MDQGGTDPFHLGAIGILKGQTLLSKPSPILPQVQVKGRHSGALGPTVSRTHSGFSAASIASFAQREYGAHDGMHISAEVLSTSAPSPGGIGAHMHEASKFRRSSSHSRIFESVPQPAHAHESSDHPYYGSVNSNFNLGKDQFQKMELARLGMPGDTRLDSLQRSHNINQMSQSQFSVPSGHALGPVRTAKSPARKEANTGHRTSLQGPSGSTGPRAIAVMGSVPQGLAVRSYHHP
mmetsp:Transcript_40054/g.62520  ORF Transcript_40054/g.62520 Transcript_40054/m.62520 type:complete len:236 (+) Transcript_40054:256-963(+)